MNGSCERSGEDEEQEEEATAACGRLAGVPQAKQGPEADSDSDLETQAVDLSENQLGVAGAQALCAAFTINRAVQKIQLSGNGLEEQAAQYLAELLLAHTDLKSLDLSYNQLNEQAGNAAQGTMDHKSSASWGRGRWGLAGPHCTLRGSMCSGSCSPHPTLPHSSSPPATWNSSFLPQISHCPLLYVLRTDLAIRDPP